MQTELNTEALKARAKRLKTALKSVVGVEVSLAQALEITAREENYPNWDTAAACRAAPVALAPVPPEEVGPSVPWPLVVQAAQEVSRRRGGLILVAGLTGSGTTTCARNLKREIEAHFFNATVEHLEDALRTDNSSSVHRKLAEGVTVISEIHASRAQRALAPTSEFASELRLVIGVSMQAGQRTFALWYPVDRLAIDCAGETIEVNPFSQASIDAAKAQAPGKGVGPAVAAELLAQMADGRVTSAVQLPEEYRRLADVAGLPG